VGPPPPPPISKVAPCVIYDIQYGMYCSEKVCKKSQFEENKTNKKALVKDRQTERQSQGWASRMLLISDISYSGVGGYEFINDKQSSNAPGPRYGSDA
jgi:hypothetical protein